MPMPVAAFSTCMCFVSCAAHAHLLMPANCCAQAAASPLTARSWRTTTPLPSAWCDTHSCCWGSIGCLSSFMYCKNAWQPQRGSDVQLAHPAARPSAVPRICNAFLSQVRSCLDLSVMWRSHHIEQSEQGVLLPICGQAGWLRSWNFAAAAASPHPSIKTFWSGPPTIAALPGPSSRPPTPLRPPPQAASAPRLGSSGARARCP